MSGRVTVYVRIWGKFQAEGTARAKALRWGVPRATKEQCGGCCAVWSEQSEHREGEEGKADQEGPHSRSLSDPRLDPQNFIFMA